MEPKPYLVLARKYRPKTFDEVVGQEAAATTLKNAVTMQRIGHAYLFTGPRGVGKTSMARIFAKALNCQSGPTVTPCGKCISCTEIDAARSLDVLEIDGASNRGIDEIRALRESVRFAPSSGKFKIYIIDEVHQITSDGFNALLKTLEEPPAHVKFIFATTSAQKVPATILSRCQRFDFRRIPTERIVQVLRELCKKEKIKADDDALFVIAQAADGSLRDSQTILDQIAASGDGKIAKEDVICSLGVLEEERLSGIMQALAQKDAAKALTLLDETLREGKDPALFLEKMLEHVRNLLFVHVSTELLELVDATESYKKTLLQQKEMLGRDELFYFFSVFSHAVQTLRRFDLKRIPIEVALIKLAWRVPMQSVAELIEGLNSEKKSPAREESRPAPKAAPSMTPPSKTTAKVREEEEEEVPEIEELSGDEEVLSSVEKASLEKVWEALLHAVKAEKMSVASYLAEGQPWSLKEGLAVIGFPPKLTFFKETLELADNKRLVERHLSRLLGGAVVVQFEVMKELAKAEDAEEAKPPAPPISPEENPAIRSAINILGGRIIQ